MFEDVIARFDELVERHHPSSTPASAALLERIGAFSRVENRAAAEQLTAIGELFAYRLSRCSECEAWAVDTEAAVSAEVAAALRISQGLAASRCGMPARCVSGYRKWARCSRPGISAT